MKPSTKLFLRYLIISVGLLGLLLMNVYWLISHHTFKAAKQNAQGTSTVVMDILKNSDETLNAEVAHLREILHKNWSGEQPNMLIESTLKSFLNSKSFYSQLRVVDEEGNETYKLIVADGKVIKAESKELLNISKDYYFSDLLDLKEGKNIYFSEFELDEDQTNSVIRTSKYFYNKEGARQYLILNFRLLEHLHKFGKPIEQGWYKFALLNEEGYFVKGLDKGGEWGHLLTERKDKNLHILYPEAAKEIYKEEFGTIETSNGVFLFNTTYSVKKGRFYKILVVAPATLLKPIIKAEFITWLQFVLGVWVVAMVLLWFLVKNLVKNRLASENMAVSNEVLDNKNQELKIANATKDKFFSIIAHDLKSPLNSLLGLSRLLKEELEGGDPENLTQYVTLIHESTEKGANLLESLLEWARLQTNSIKLQPSKFTLGELQEKVSAAIDVVASEKRIKIVWNTNADEEVSADLNMLSTVLRNLISNSIKFSEYGKTVCISNQKEGNDMRFCVQDTGVGMTGSQVNKLFKIESNFSTSGTNNEQGTGLGLIISKEFIELHNGGIWVESDLGEGSKFYFNIAQ
jgi:signal transduction histidine kinase